jgi:serine/threonine-protein kinase
MEIAHKIATEGAPDLRDARPTAPPEAAKALKRGMALDPEDRPASAGEFARELAGALDAAGAPETTRQQKTAKTRRLGGGRRSKRAAGAVGAAGAAAAGAAAGQAAAAEPAAGRRAAAIPGRAPLDRAAAAPAPDPDPTPRSTPPAYSASPPTGPPHAARTHGAGRERPRAGVIALAAIFIALAIATIAGAVLSGGGGGGGDDGSPSSGANQPASPAKPQAKKDQPKADNQPKADKTPKEDTPAAPAPQEEQSSSGSDDPARGAALNKEGFDLMNAGDYDAAIPKLQEAVNSFPPDTTDLNYAYALFNLGKALRLAGRPDEAIPILEQRLQIPNQTETVKAELEQAKKDAKKG